MTPPLKRLRRKRAGKVPGNAPRGRPDRRRRSAPDETACRADGGAMLRIIGAKTPTQGLGMLLGAPGDVYDILHHGYTYGVTKGAEKLGLISPDEGDEMRQSATPAEPAFGAKAMTRYLQNAFGQSGDTAPPDDPAAPDRRRGGPVPGAGRQK